MNRHTVMGALGELQAEGWIEARERFRYRVVETLPSQFLQPRAGFVAVPPKIGVELAKLKRISSRQNESLLQEAIGLWMESGGFERHLRRMRRAYQERLEAMTTALHEHKTDFPRISWTTPDGGRGPHLRLGFSGQTPAENAAGLRALFKAINRW